MNLVEQITEEKGWTLFLDRDGVINVRLIDEYVRHWDEFTFIDGVLESIPVFNRFFSRIIIVTNQQGIGKDLMNEYDLGVIHGRMLSNMESSSGHIDGVFYCPHLKSAGCTCRKPLPGMAKAAVLQFGDINLSKSVMAGDSLSDMTFAENAGMKAVFIGAAFPRKGNPHAVYSSLLEFAQELVVCPKK